MTPYGASQNLLLPRSVREAHASASLLWWLLVLPFFANQFSGFADFVGSTLAAAGFGAGWAIGVSDWHLRSPLMSLALRRIPLTEPRDGQHRAQAVDISRNSDT